MAELFLLTFDRAGITQLHRTAQGANLATLERLGRFRAHHRDLRQPPTANSSFSRITLSGSSRGNRGSQSGVIAWRNKLNQLPAVRPRSASRGHSAASGSQQVIRTIPSSIPACGGLTGKHNPIFAPPRPPASEFPRIGWRETPDSLARRPNLPQPSIGGIPRRNSRARFAMTLSRSRSRAASRPSVPSSMGLRPIRNMMRITCI
jgi:hypothetical protein